MKVVFKEYFHYQPSIKQEIMTLKSIIICLGITFDNPRKLLATFEKFSLI